MAVVSYRKFRGEIPAIEPHLLPVGAAQLAKNCTFTSGSLQSQKGGLAYGAMVSSPVKGIYTENGLTFYTWPTETLPFRSPIIGDSFSRMYFLTPSEGIFRAASTLSMASNGPTPIIGNTYRTGVPRPTVAPTLTLIDRTTLPDHPSVLVTFDFWYEADGEIFQESVAIANTVVSAFKEYTFTPPMKSGVTPSYATVAVRMKIDEVGGTNLLSVTLRPSATARLSAFPGTQELTMTATDAQIKVAVVWGAEETRAYVYVNENTWNEEGATSPASVISPTYLQDVQITVTPSDFTGYRPFLRHRIYRTYGSTPAYVGAGTTGTSPTYTDASRTPSSVGSSLLSDEWDPAPDGIEGAEYMPGGIFAVFKGNALYVSEPYRPHAFPYIHTFLNNIRGIKAAQQSLVVTTADGIYILAGSAPASMQPIKVSTPQPGISQRSMTSIDGGVAYASRDGLVLVDGAQASMQVSQKLFGRSKWRELYNTILADASMRFAFHDGHLVVSSHSTSAGFTLRFDEDIGSLARHEQRMDSTFQLPVEDSLYYSVGSTLYKYQGGDDMAFDWHGKDEVFAKHEVFGAGYLRASGPVTLKLYGDGVLVVDKTISPGYFRLPSEMPRVLRLSIRLQGSGSVQEISLARTMAELQVG